METGALLWWGSRPLESKEEQAEDEEKKTALRARAALLRWSRERSSFYSGKPSRHKVLRDAKRALSLLADKPKVDAAGRLVHPSAGVVGASRPGGGVGGAGKGARDSPAAATASAASKEIDTSTTKKSKLSSLETAGIEWCAKRRAIKRRERRREIRADSRSDETFAPTPALDLPSWYTRRRALVRWHRFVTREISLSPRRAKKKQEQHLNEDDAADGDEAVQVEEWEEKGAEEDLWRGFAHALMRAASWAHGDAPLTFGHARAEANRRSRRNNTNSTTKCSRAIGPVFGGGRATGGAPGPGHHTKRIQSQKEQQRKLPLVYPGGYGEER